MSVNIKILAAFSVSGSNISHTSSRYQKIIQWDTVSIKMFSLVKASRKSSNPVYYLIFQPPLSQISRMSKYLPQCLRQDFLAAAGEKGVKIKLDLICSAWVHVLCTFSTLTMNGHGRADQYLHVAAVVGEGGIGNRKWDVYTMGDGASPHNCSGQARAWQYCYIPS